MVMTDTHPKAQGQRSLGSNVRVETDRQTEAIALPPVLTRSVTVRRPPLAFLAKRSECRLCITLSLTLTLNLNLILLTLPY